MAITINKQIYANGWTYMASFLYIPDPHPVDPHPTKWHRSRKLFSNNMIIIIIIRCRRRSLCMLSCALSVLLTKSGQSVLSRLRSC